MARLETGEVLGLLPAEVGTCWGLGDPGLTGMGTRKGVYTWLDEAREEDKRDDEEGEEDKGGAAGETERECDG